MGRVAAGLMLLGVPAQSQDLQQSMASLDAEVFDAYNRCELGRFAVYFSDDVEFYHDQSGLSIGKQKLIEALKNNICGKVRRELVPGTLKAYPMKGFGAVQMGVHRFHHPGAEDREPVGEASFVHLWQQKDGMWKIVRVISYDHHALPK